MICSGCANFITSDDDGRTIAVVVIGPDGERFFTWHEACAPREARLVILHNELRRHAAWS